MSYPKTLTLLPRAGYEGALDRLHDALTEANIPHSQTDYSIKIVVTTLDEDRAIKAMFIGCHAKCPYGRTVKNGCYAAICAGASAIDPHCHTVITT
jgi:hypothetical protein